MSLWIWNEIHRKHFLKKQNRTKPMTMISNYLDKNAILMIIIIGKNVIITCHDIDCRFFFHSLKHYIEWKCFEWKLHFLNLNSIISLSNGNKNKFMHNSWFPLSWLMFFLFRIFRNFKEVVVVRVKKWNIKPDF